MKKIKSFFYWPVVLFVHLVAFFVMAYILAVVFGLPDNIGGGIISCVLIICGLILTADDDTLDFVKKTIKKGPADDKKEGV